MNAPKWNGLGYLPPKKWTFKKDMPVELRPEAKLVDFGLFGRAYIAVDHTGAAYMPDGQRMRLMEFYLKTPGHVIGPRDTQAAAHQRWSFEWQTASAERMLEEATLRAQVGGRH